MTDIPENPLDYFSDWFEQASHHKGIEEANAVNVSTATSNGLPSSRMVLLKSFDDSGFVFYTNLGSRKAQQLEQNPHAAMCFYWEPLARQVRIEGQVFAVDSKQADDYFKSRPFKSKIGAWASRQSQALDHQNTLLKEIAKQAARYVAKRFHAHLFGQDFAFARTISNFGKGENIDCTNGIAMTGMKTASGNHICFILKFNLATV